MARSSFVWHLDVIGVHPCKDAKALLAAEIDFAITNYVMTSACHCSHTRELIKSKLPNTITAFSNHFAQDGNALPIHHDHDDEETSSLSQ
eukprot:2059065-Amphidinium_carterae.1